ncbi:condensation domain-containing protein [Streptomyces sp. 142MFCol3.1]|uniref:condensation domain-containing protein n=1 Tax=Streptomyces sp. 142MFCol3.1 TaxID=1172179 RepID=UPI00131A46A0|nr:condensation domain-containing protein [Streptomyces sp. 142MFCol3.1]
MDRHHGGPTVDTVLDTPLPLSVGQEGLWLLQRLAPDSATYNLAGGARMTPAPDPEILGRAVRALTDRHPMLRSRYTESDGQPCRVVEAVGALAELTAREVPDATDEELDALVRAEVRRPFHLDTEGPFRAVLLRRRDDAVALVVTHHIATDAFSQWLLWRDLLQAYEAFAAGQDDPGWEPLPVAYDDFVERERMLLDSSRGKRQAEFWQEEAAGAQAAELPTDRPRPAVSSQTGASLVRRLPDRLSDKVLRTAVQRGVSPFALTLGAFQSLLHRWGGQRDFLLACPASTRRSSAAQVVGYFVNPVLIRGRFGRDTTLADAMTQAAERVRQATARVSYPYPLVARDAGTTGPLYRISVTMVATDRFGPGMGGAASGEPMTVAGIETTYLEIPHLEGQCDLSLEITRDVYGLTMALRFDTDLFERATVERLFDVFLRFVEAAADDPDQRVSRIPLTDAAERRALLALGGAGSGGTP